MISDLRKNKKHTNMKKEDFDKLWPTIQNEPVNIEVGKSSYANVILKKYTPFIGVVYTSMSGQLNVRSIKTVTLVNPPKPKEEPKPKEVFTTQESKIVRKWEGMLKKGYFIIVGRMGSLFRRVELREESGKVTKASNDSFLNQDKAFDWIFEEMARPKKVGEAPSPDVVIDDTFAVPQYFTIIGAKKFKVED